MFPKTHIIFGFIFSLILFLLFPSINWVGFFMIFASSVLIDVDHYLFYAVTKKDWSLIRAYKWFVKGTKRFEKLSIEEKKKSKSIVCIFHGIESLIILFVLSYFSNFFFFILIGFLFHELLDLIHILYWNYDINHLGFQTYNLLRERKIKRRYNKNSNQRYI